MFLITSSLNTVFLYLLQVANYVCVYKERKMTVEEALA